MRRTFNDDIIRDLGHFGKEETKPVVEKPQEEKQLSIMEKLFGIFGGLYGSQTQK